MLAYLFVSFLRNIRRLWRRFLMGLHIKNMHGLLTARKRGSENRPSFRFSCSLQKPHTSDKFLKPEVSLTCIIQQMSNKKRQNLKNYRFFRKYSFMNSSISARSPVILFYKLIHLRQITRDTLLQTHPSPPDHPRYFITNASISTRLSEKSIKSSSPGS